MTDAGDEPVRLRTFGTRKVYQDPELWVGQLDVELPGDERVWEPVVRLSQVAVLALLDRDERVLLVRRYRVVPGRLGWELPGDPADEDEELSDAAAWELEDTTGYRVGRVDELISFWPMAETVDCEHVAFVGRDPQLTGRVAVRGGEVRAEWVPLASVRELIAAGEIWHAGSLVALLRLLAPDGTVSAR